MVQVQRYGSFFLSLFVALGIGIAASVAFLGAVGAVGVAVTPCQKGYTSTAMTLDAPMPVCPKQTVQYVNAKGETSSFLVRSFTPNTIAIVTNGNPQYVQISPNQPTWVEMKSQSFLVTYYGLNSDKTQGMVMFNLLPGTVVISKHADSSSGFVPPGTVNVLLAKFEVKAEGEDLEIRKMGIRIPMTGPATKLTGNIKLVSNGATLVSFAANDDLLYASESTGGVQKTLSNFLKVKVGQSKIVEVYGDIDVNADGTGYTVNMGNFYMKRLVTLDFVDNVPSTLTDISANTITVQAPSLSFAKDTSLGNKNSVNSASHTVAQFVATAGSAEGVYLTNLSCTHVGTVSALLDLSNLQVWGKIDGGSELAIAPTIESLTTGSNSFTLGYLIPKGKTATITLKAYVDADASGTVIFACTPTYIGEVSNILKIGNTAIGQTMTIGSANVVIYPTNDSSTMSSIHLPSVAPKQVGKWTYTSQYEKTIVEKITFKLHTPNGIVHTSASEFGTIYLFDAADMSTPLAESTYISGTGNGYVQFQKANMVTVEADETKQLVLMATINPSGIMTPGAVHAWTVANSTMTNWTVKKNSGSQITADKIDIAQNSDGVVGNMDMYATSTFYLYHNTAPTISPVSMGTSLEIGTQTPIFKFSVSNNGDRELRLGATTINVAATGLVAGGSMGTGTIHSFTLWEANALGGLGTKLATTTPWLNYSSSGVAPKSSTGLVCIAGGTPTYAENGSCVGTDTSLNLIFGPLSDYSSLFDNLTIPVGGSRTFVLTADTSDILDQKTSGTVSVTAKLSPSASLITNPGTGFKFGDALYESQWTNGVLQYFYTPANGGVENSMPYSASDSYDVIGPTLSKTL